MSELIVRARGGGKTTELIRRAAEAGGYIVCRDQRTARGIAMRAKDMGLNIPFPLTAAEFFGGEFHTPGVKGFLFDDLDHLIQAQARGVPVLAATWTVDDTTAGDQS